MIQTLSANNAIQLRDFLENQITREDRITVARAKPFFWPKPAGSAALSRQVLPYRNSIKVQSRNASIVIPSKWSQPHSLTGRNSWELDISPPKKKFLTYPNKRRISPRKGSFPSLFHHTTFQSLGYVMKRAAAFRVCPPPQCTRAGKDFSQSIIYRNG